MRTDRFHNSTGKGIHVLRETHLPVQLQVVDPNNSLLRSWLCHDLYCQAPIGHYPKFCFWNWRQGFLLEHGDWRSWWITKVVAQKEFCKISLDAVRTVFACHSNLVPDFVL